MRKKAAIFSVFLLLMATSASVPASAGAAFALTALGEGISLKTGQVYEVMELGRAYTFTLKLDADSAYTGSSVKVNAPGGVKLEYNAGASSAADWRTAANGEIILDNLSIASGASVDIPMRVSLLRAGGHSVGFSFYHSADSDTVESGLTTTWTTPISKYSISFAEVPQKISSGAAFNFKAYVRNTQSAAFDYDQNAVIHIGVTPSTDDYTIGEREGQKAVEPGQSSGSMDFVLPGQSAVKTIDYTAVFERDGVYTLTFTLMEAGDGGRVIATNSLSVQVGSTTVYNPGTGDGGSSDGFITTALPFFTLILFALVYKQYKKETF